MQLLRCCLLLSACFLQRFANCEADSYCIEEESNSVVVDRKPAKIFSVDAPHVCVSACIKWAAEGCSTSAFSRLNFRSNGTCFLYTADDRAVHVKRRMASKGQQSAGALFSVYRVLSKCRSLDDKVTAEAKRYISMGGSAVLNIEGRAAYGIPVQMHLDDWGPWSAWSDCVHPSLATSEMALKNRIRICGSCGAKRVLEFETVPCGHVAYLPPVARAWGPWSPCSVSCGLGESVRKLSCGQPDPCDGQEEEEQEARPCTMPPCAAWSVWAPWAHCVGECGLGSRARLRRCSGVGLCSGSDREVAICTDVPPCCTDWYPLGGCSTSCGDGVQIRTRQCNPPFHPMTPHLEETIPCNMGPCSFWAPCIVWGDNAQPIINQECMIRKSTADNNDNKPTIAQHHLEFVP